jgi:MFS family permease
MVVGLLFLFMLINFADRAVLGLAAVPIMQELSLSHTEFGLIATSFFTLFSVGGVIGGFLVNRVATKWVLAALAVIWSLCQLPMLLSATVTALVARGRDRRLRRIPALVDTGAGTSQGISNALLLAGVIVVLGSIAGFFLIDPEADRARHSADSRLEARLA